MIRGVQPREFMIFRNILKSGFKVFYHLIISLKGHDSSEGLMTREIKTLMQKMYMNT